MHERVPDRPRDITGLLKAWSGGDRRALDELMPLVYADLRRRAAALMRRERVEHTLQPTAVVHEAFMRLVKAEGVAWKDRVHFFGVAARAMREVLVDHARRHDAAKRGTHRKRFSIDVVDVTVHPRTVDLLALDQALKTLASLDERQVRLVELRLFAGLTVQESAEVLGCSSATASRDYRHAEAWLRRQMRGATA
jgi:RNA polymerase sigma factor (TIGR02999 family)